MIGPGPSRLGRLRDLAPPGDTFNRLRLMVRRRAQRAVSNHGSKFGLAAILRDALASLGLLRMRPEGWKDSQPLRVTHRKHSAAMFSSANTRKAALQPSDLCLG